MSDPDGETFRDEGSTAVLLDATLPGELGGVFFAGNKGLNSSPPFAVKNVHGFLTDVRVSCSAVIFAETPDSLSAVDSATGLAALGAL